MIKIGIIGATGYAGAQLVWILHNHPKADIKFLCSNSYAGESYSDIYKNFSGHMYINCVSMEEAYSQLDAIDVLFLAMPHGKSFDISKAAVAKGKKVIDLGADFRLKDITEYEEWYKVTHQAVDLLKEAVYGLPELNREKIKGAGLVANPGCYPTASILALAPLLKNDIIDTSSIIIDAKSGVTGAGRSAVTNNLYCECNDSIKAYAITTHRHTPEIEQVLSGVSGKDITLTFTPHLTPMSRGILSVCYGKLNDEYSESTLLQLYRDFYKEEYFVKILDAPPETRYTKGSNMCHISLRVDKRTNRVIVVSAIDNLIKGAAGQAVQNMNILFGLNENTGINFPAMVP
ncbi:MAG: N-acetyl-gamma-glutamyl-phosphate reductase [Firmicutes bacterium]|nr:N-acetyl-gamma-glutamyl-phosphate reductase [Bacillota bacterium]